VAKFYDAVWPQRSWYTEPLDRNGKKRQIWRKNERNIFSVSLLLFFFVVFLSPFAWPPLPVTRIGRLLYSRSPFLFLSSSIFNTSFNLSAYPHYFVPLQCQTKIVCRQNLMTSYIYCTAYELRCIRSGLTVSPKKQTSGVQDLEQSSQFREMTKGSEGTLSNV